MSDFGRVVTVHPRREHEPLPVTEPVIEPAYVPVPLQPSEKAARRRKLWEGPQPRRNQPGQPEPLTEPVREPVRMPEKESPPCR